MLIIEDGTGVANADSYISLADARLLAANYGVALPVDDVEAEVELRKGYLGLNTNEPQLQGYRTHQVQTGIFPRTGVYKNCVEIPNDSIPQGLLMAQLYQANAYTSGVDANSVDNGQEISEFNVQGVYSEKYFDKGNSKTNSVVSGVYNSLFDYSKAGFASSDCGGGSNGFGGGLGREEFGTAGVQWRE
jgi:hypothetical protein